MVAWIRDGSNSGALVPSRVMSVTIQGLAPLKDGVGQGCMGFVITVIWEP